MEDASLGRRISLLYRYGNIYLARELEPYAIGKGQILFLLALYRSDGLLQEQLAQYLKIDKGTTARAISKLEKAGYISRESKERDQRANKIFLTPKARDFQPALTAILQRWTQVLSCGMTAEEIAQAHDLLDKMARNAVRYVQGGQCAPTQRRQEHFDMPRSKNDETKK